jgi:dTDP-glucose 4,6-dehydratase
VFGEGDQSEAGFQRRMVVTGGAGFLGTHLSEQLIRSGHEVIVIDNFSTACRDNAEYLIRIGAKEVIEADVCDSCDVAGAVDIIFHLASPASPKFFGTLPVETLRASSIGTLNALGLAEKTGARFVFASTSEVYGDPLENPQSEGYRGNVSSVGPRSCYDEAKRFGEAATAAYALTRGVNAGIVRIFNTYGPRMRPDDGRAVPHFINQALRGEDLTVYGDGRQTRSLCYVNDTVRGLMAMGVSNFSGPVNIGSAEEISVLELARVILKITSAPGQVTFQPALPDDPKQRRADASLAAAELGWRPQVSLDDGLRATVQWFRALRSRCGHEEDSALRNRPGEPQRDHDTTTLQSTAPGGQ